ncbi:hypothetical protein BC941DRAFT_462215 [Chlamydoabsidia padenii]|nr:hypothetical protein BC941DRAFT_462215 [Chlamydoabsidia padenii]
MSSSSTTGEILSAPKLTIHISGESTSQKGVLEWCDANGSVIDNTPSLANAANTSILGQSTISGKCVSKQLHINDADEKRRRVELLVKIQLGNGLNLGTLPSKGIKVISKPSKKRQSSKNTELCIHHGSTVSLFNRIRSQTVSTKYLGVANGDPSSNGNTGTCFTARTNSWDPFVIWIVDTTRSPDSASSTPPQLPHHPLNPEFPPPPAVALQSGMNQQSPIVIHYNQAVVLQCVSTGLVSPVMVIRKVDRGSAVLGGNCMEDLSGLTGGECGDEALGDPVSQLHKIAFQIVHDTSVAYNNKMNYHQRSPPMSTTGWTLPQTTYTISYLACLNDVVGMHKTTTERTFVSTRPPTSPTAAPSQWSSDVCATQSVYNADLSDAMSCVSQIESIGKVVRKRRVSCDVGKPSVSNNQRRRVNSLSDIKAAEDGGRRGSFADRRGSVSSDNGNPVDGNCWTEDVSDAAVWTIMGTEAVKYTFWTPPPTERDNMAFNNPFACPQQSHPITPFPIINSIASPSSSHKMLISGDNLTRDLSVWFGDIKAPLTEYKSRELLSCTVPDISDLTCSVVATTDDKHSDLMKLPILLVRGDGVVYRTDNFYSF